MSDIVIDDKIWKDLIKKIGKDLASKGVRVGVLAEKGGNENREGITMVELAAIHEFGSPAAGIPERSFIRATFDDAGVQSEQAALSTKIVKGILTDRFPVDTGLELLGAWATARIKKFIVAKQITPDISDETKAAKGSTTALVDTGRLINALNHKVE